MGPLIIKLVDVCTQVLNFFHCYMHMTQYFCFHNIFITSFPQIYQAKDLYMFLKKVKFFIP